MNIDNAVDKAWEGKSLKEIANAPISALQGISEEGAKKIVDGMNIKDSIQALGESKFVNWAQAIAALAATEK